MDHEERMTIINKGLNNSFLHQEENFITLVRNIVKNEILQSNSKFMEKARRVWNLFSQFT